MILSSISYHLNKFGGASFLPFYAFTPSPSPKVIGDAPKVHRGDLLWRKEYGVIAFGERVRKDSSPLLTYGFFWKSEIRRIEDSH